MLAATIIFAIKTITTTITTITEIETTETEEEEAVTESSEETTDEMTDFVMTEERTAVGTDGQCSPLSISFTPLPHYFLPPFMHSLPVFSYYSLLLAFTTSAVLYAH